MATSTQDAPQQQVALLELISASFSAAFAAGDVIRQVVREDIAFDLVNKTENEFDPQTVADRRAQLRIVHALRQLFPAVQIVGEEGDLGEPEPPDRVQADMRALPFDALEISSRHLPAKDLVLWIDPLDGTKKFAAREFDEVSVLIGIAMEKRPIAGVMHFPFRGSLGTSYWGGVGIGVFHCVHENSDLRSIQHVRMDVPTRLVSTSSGATDKLSVTITRSSAGCALIDELIKQVDVDQVLYGRATGAMILNVLQGSSDAYLRIRRNTRRWDICAVESLVMAMGGCIVNKYGQPYQYDAVSDNGYDNEDGLLVYLEDVVKQTLLPAIAQVEFMRSLDGTLFTTESLSTVLNHPVTSFEVLRGSVARGRQSITGRLQVTFKSKDARDGERKESIFVKRIVRQELTDRSLQRWARNMPSYRNECRFYQDCYEMLAPTVRLIQPFAVFDEPTALQPDSEPAFLFLMEDLHEKDYVQLDCLTVEQAKAALRYLASLHATAWGSKDILERVKGRLWTSGGWWQLQKRGTQELQQSCEIWSDFIKNFASVALDGLLTGKAMKTLADRMIELAPFISSNLFDEELIRPWKTLVHGDFKSANLFFHKDTLEVVAFDWQWSGTGLAAIDVAYFLNTSVHIDALENGNEEGLIEFYFEELTQKLASLGRPLAGYSFDAFRRHYCYGVLEYARVLLSVFWKRLTPESCEAKASQTNCGLGYRSIAHALRLAKRMDELLQLVADECNATAMTS